MVPLSYLTIIAGVSLFSNVCDYVSFSRKHRETQELIKCLKNEIYSLNKNINYMRKEIKNNIKNT